jgi:hypothetical protein
VSCWKRGPVNSGELGAEKGVQLAGDLLGLRNRLAAHRRAEIESAEDAA